MDPSKTSEYDSYGSVDSIGPVDSVSPLDSVDAANFVNSIDSIHLTDPADMIDSAESMDSVDSIDSITWVDSISPAPSQQSLTSAPGYHPDDVTGHHPDDVSGYHPDDVSGYHPDDAQYLRNRIAFAGTTISHLPVALFELMQELCHRFRRSDRCIIYPEDLQYCKEERLYYRGGPDDLRYMIDKGRQGRKAPEGLQCNEAQAQCHQKEAFRPADSPANAALAFRQDAVFLQISVYSDAVRKGITYLSLEMTELPAGLYGQMTGAVSTQNSAPRRNWSFLNDSRRGSERECGRRSQHESGRESVCGSKHESGRESVCGSERKSGCGSGRESDSRRRYGLHGFQQAALVLRMNGSMKSRYYFTAKRFLNANRGKYVIPGLRPPQGRNWRVCVFDTEMERPYPIQFAGVLLEKTTGGWSVLSRFDTYFHLPAGVHLSRDVARVTKISEELLRKEGLPEAEADEQIQAFLSQADILCGHAVLADKEIMRTSFLRQQRKLPYSLRRHEMIDTQIILERLYHLDNAVKLARAAELVGIRRAEDVFHDARTDADVTARILTELEPVFVQKYKVEPVVFDAMMHAPQQTQLLGRLNGKKGGGTE